MRSSDLITESPVSTAKLAEPYSSLNEIATSFANYVKTNPDKALSFIEKLLSRYDHSYLKIEELKPKDLEEEQAALAFVFSPEEEIICNEIQKYFAATLENRKPSSESKLETKSEPTSKHKEIYHLLAKAMELFPELFKMLPTHEPVVLMNKFVPVEGMARTCKHRIRAITLESCLARAIHIGHVEFVETVFKQYPTLWNELSLNLCVVTAGSPEMVKLFSERAANKNPKRSVTLFAEVEENNPYLFLIEHFLIFVRSMDGSQLGSSEHGLFDRPVLLNDVSVTSITNLLKSLSCSQKHVDEALKAIQQLRESIDENDSTNEYKLEMLDDMLEFLKKPLVSSAKFDPPDYDRNFSIDFLKKNTERTTYILKY